MNRTSVLAMNDPWQSSSVTYAPIRAGGSERISPGLLGKFGGGLAIVQAALAPSSAHADTPGTRMDFAGPSSTGTAQKEPLRFAFDKQFDARIKGLELSGSSLSAAVDRLQGSQASIQLQLDAVTRALANFVGFEGGAPVSALAPELFEGILSIEEAAERLDFAADQDTIPPSALRLAKASIGSDDSFLRAAAARVLAAGEPELARELIPAMIAKEQGQTARSILEAALRSASL